MGLSAARYPLQASLGLPTLATTSKMWQDPSAAVAEECCSSAARPAAKVLEHLHELLRVLLVEHLEALLVLQAQLHLVLLLQVQLQLLQEDLVLLL